MTPAHRPLLRASASRDPTRLKAALDAGCAHLRTRASRARRP
jgi:hypothetical protein